MSDYNGITPLLNTIEGMDHLVVSTAHDDDTITFTGVDWFSFAGVLASTLYVSGNAWIGIGTNAEQLKVCRRDGKMWDFYRQEGTMWEYYRFIKLRWEGYTQYSVQDAYCRLIYELFLIDDGRMFLNVVQTPTNSGYLGSSTLTCGSENLSLAVGVNNDSPFYFTFIPSDVSTGTGWSVSNTLIDIIEPYNRRYLIGDSSGKLYTIADSSLVELTETIPTKALFLSDGFEEVPDGSLLLSLENPRVYFWHDSDDDLPSIHIAALQTPKPQPVITEKVHLSHPTIVGVENVVIDADDNTLFAVSFDDGLTWWNYVNDTWSLLSEELSGQTKATMEAISTNAWAQKVTAGGTLRFRFVISGNGYVKSITIHYLN